jgi:hypothetical protein
MFETRDIQHGPGHEHQDIHVNFNEVLLGSYGGLAVRLIECWFLPTFVGLFCGFVALTLP